jgi:hypothetical protein
MLALPIHLIFAVEDVLFAVAGGGGLQGHGVRTVFRLCQSERSELVEPGHLGQPALLLLLGAKHPDRPHSEPGLYCLKGTEAAVAAVELHVDQACSDRAHRRAAVTLDAVPDDAEGAHLLDERPRELRAFPVTVDDGKHVVVNQGPGASQIVPFGVDQIVA